MKRFLIVVDMQKDFVDGSLGTAEAQAMVPNAVRKVKESVSDPDCGVLFTLDTHPEGYLETQEGRNLPVPHCIRGSEGWKLIPELERIRREKGLMVFEKPTFGSRLLGEYLVAENRKEKIESIELIGLCTDICVVSNALLIKAFLPEVPVSVDASACAGVTPAAHEAALDVMRSCQIRVL